MRAEGYQQKTVAFKVSSITENDSGTVVEFTFHPDPSGVSKVMDIFLEEAKFTFPNGINAGAEGDALLLESYGSPGYRTTLD